MSNIQARLDHLLDRFKHDLRELIDAAVGEEREKLLEDIRVFTGGKVKQAIITPPPAMPALPSVADIEKTERQPKVPKPCGFCLRRGEPCVRHGGKSSQYVPVKKKPKLDAPVERVIQKDPPADELSNRPLIEFVGKKKDSKPFLCGFCGKPADGFYCTKFCESEDKRLKEISSKPKKSYAQILAEKGIEKKKPILFHFNDRKKEELA